MIQQTDVIAAAKGNPPAPDLLVENISNDTPKRLKQARLPFKSLSKSNPSPIKTQPDPKKRRVSKPDASSGETFIVDLTSSPVQVDPSVQPHLPISKSLLAEFDSCDANRVFFNENDAAAVNSPVKKRMKIATDSPQFKRHLQLSFDNFETIAQVDSSVVELPAQGISPAKSPVGAAASKTEEDDVTSTTEDDCLVVDAVSGFVVTPDKPNLKSELKTPKHCSSRKNAPKMSKEEREKLKKQREEARLIREEEGRLRKEVQLAKQKEREELKAKKEKEKEELRVKREHEITARQEKLKKKEDEKKAKDQTKEEERKRKEEERVKKEEERKQKDDEKAKVLEARDKKAKAAFAGFFVKKSPPNKTALIEAVAAISFVKSEDACNFKPFDIKMNMRLAPSVRVSAQSLDSLRKRLDAAMNSADNLNWNGALYLQELKLSSKELLKTGATWPLAEKPQIKRPNQGADADSDIVVIDEELDEVDDLDDCAVTGEDDQKNTAKERAKLFQFEENVRPPYWGTWRKRSTVVSGRRPFAKHETFDYEIDSDEEWEDEPGENLEDTDNEQESEDDYEVDNKFFVPHGYLSAEEEGEEDGDSTVAPRPDGDDIDADRNARLRAKENEFKADLKKECTKLKPRVLGCFWVGDVNNKVPDKIVTYLKKYSAICMTSSPISTSFTNPTLTQLGVDINSTSNATCALASPSGVKRKRSSPTSNSKIVPVPLSALPYLIELVHANRNNQMVIVNEFMAFWLEKLQSEASDMCHREHDCSRLGRPCHLVNECRVAFSKAQLERTIKGVASYTRYVEDGPFKGKKCWYVTPDVRAKYGKADLTAPNSWTYRTDPKLTKTADFAIKFLVVPECA